MNTNLSRLRRCTGSLAGTGVLLLGVLAGCNGSNNRPAEIQIVPSGPKEPTAVAGDADAPGIVLDIRAIEGASGADGTFQVGDRLTVTFTAKKNNGTAWRTDDFSSGRILVSGPTVNYQRVLPEQQDLLTASRLNADGSFTYTFAEPLPATYAAPLNDTPSFGSDDGELTGQPLQAGTYTVGMYVAWSYTVGDEPFRDAGDATEDFLFGGATALMPRQVVGQQNCNQCHVSLRAHGGRRRSTALCLLCHTSGAEDNNDPALANGTPDVSIDFRVLVHRLHNGAHLPSVLGVDTNPDGSRNFAATPKPYLVAGNSSVHDFSAVVFPAWPAGLIAMPRDAGYTSLTTAQKALEDTMRTGVTHCAVCHGDPDRNGPLAAPAQGELAHAQPSRRACGACHDDVDWRHPYTANGSTMPAQDNDSACLLCHGVVGGALAPDVAHLHPMLDAVFNTGTNVSVTGVAEAGVHDHDGTIDPGEKVAITFRVTDDTGADIAPSALASVTTIVSGPTTNSNMVLNGSIPTAALSGSQPFTVNLPQAVVLEFVGNSTAALGDTFTSARTPHWDMSGAATTVFVRTATSGGNSLLAADAPTPRNWLDVVDPAGFARNDFVVVDDGATGQVEYVQVTYVEGNRLWLAASSPLTRSHLVGAMVLEVTLTQKTRNTHYSLAAATGSITEVAEFGDGNAVVVSYTSDFLMPQVFPLPLNDTPTIDETGGEWAGKPIVDGTYAVTVYPARNLTLNLFNESNSYRSVANGARAEFLVGSATELAPYALIDSSASCNACHQDVMFHGGGRRGFTTCIACHGTAGAEDRPQYTAPNAPATPGVTINFRSMLHKIHMGEELANASTYTVVGFGGAAYPNNYTAHTYGEVVFPAQPGGVAQCTKCHGTDNLAWLTPQPRNHPTAQGRQVLAWRTACGACHDADASTAHMQVQTSVEGVESCAVCHGTDREWHVKLMHKVR
jgi:OmcA/MtrC family decaheme c-type cytochrome